ncbi:MAG: YdbH domain-containing protein, partial [Novosphingobium sp.]
WFSRENLADRVIASELNRLGLPATYDIVSIGPRRQVLANVVIGNPARPDFTVERVEVGVKPSFGGTGLGRITLVRPRLYGSYRQGQVSFGSLDKLLFAGPARQKFRFPDLDLDVADGRALIESDAGPVGVTLEGRGRLRGGFAGTVAALAPQLDVAGCRVGRASIVGRIAVSAERPRFNGPLRLATLACPASGLRLADAALTADVTFDSALDGAGGSLRLRTGGLALGAQRVAATAGDARLTWREHALAARYRLSGEAMATSPLAARRIAVEGELRGRNGLTRIETDGHLTASEVVPGAGLDAALVSAERTASGSFAAPLLAQIRAALRREGSGSTLAGDYLLQRGGGQLSLAVPSARWTGSSGATLLAISRLNIDASSAGSPRLAGNFTTGGPGMPRITGRMEPGPGGLVMRLAMQDYRAGVSRLAVPRLVLAQAPGGALGFVGEARISGALPGGSAEALALPIDGSWSRGTGLTLWRRCTDVRFDRLRYANLSLDGRALTLCPPRGGAIVRANARGTRIAAGAPALAVSGRLGATPIRIATGPIGFAVPGVLKASAVEVALGPAATASRFRIAALDARIGRDIAGRFAGSDIRLASVPLDLSEAAGRWRYAGGKLTIADAAFRLLDRQPAARFRPLAARGGNLSLANNRITAEALLREPASDREVVRARIVHDLAAGRGEAALQVADLRFDKRLQPDTLTPLALGVIANAEGSVRGSGRIVWNPRGVTSTGSFTSDSLNFAAAFGPVRGMSGTVVFTDLLGLVTAPDQRLKIAAINPGIEVNDGVLSFALRPNQVIAVNGAHWPFFGGTLTMEPTTLTMGAAETRHFTLAIDGLDASRFVQRVGLANISATGTFDGRMPLVFDQNGGRIEGGRLRARPPGGNVSYVGALTYKDLSPMANFAFDALKSLDYREMTIAMDGAIAGELVTRVRFNGVTQGAAAKRNFLTRRISSLPIQFNVNLRAPFFQLITSVKSLYDPAYVRDPRDLGLLTREGRPVPPRQVQPPASEPVR